MIQRLELFNSHRPLDVMLHWHKNGYLLLDPPYQRGDVWGLERRQNLIRSLLQGIPIASIIVNDRFKAANDSRGKTEWDRDDITLQFAVIDGKQRITSVLWFLQGKFSVPGCWFGYPRSQVSYGELDVVDQRRFRNIPMAFCEGCLPSVEAEQLVFELVNYGGVPQGESDV